MKFRFLVCFTIVFTAFSVHPVRAQESPAVTIGAGNLTNPRSVMFDGSGQVIVTEAGSGGATLGVAEMAAPIGSISGGPTGRLSVILDGCPSPAITNLPSARNGLGDVFGPTATVTLGGRAFLLVGGGGEANGNGGLATGIYEITTGSATLLVDLGTWFDTNPSPAQATDPVIAHGNWVGMVAAPEDDSLVLAEKTGKQLIQVSLDGAVTRLPALENQELAPTALLAESDGTVLVAMAPDNETAPGQSLVTRITRNGDTEAVWTGLTMVSSIVRDGDGSLIATQQSELRDRPPYLVPGTGSIVRQTGPNLSELLVDQLNFPGGLAIAPDGSLYGLLSTTGSDTGTGLMIRLDLAGPLPVHGQDLNLTAPSCTSNVTAVEVVVDDRGFNPSTVTVAPGTTVTWRFGGEFDHAVVADSSSALTFDSGVLGPGETFSVTFTDPGVYTYFDGLYPERTGEIVVTDS